MKSCCEILSKSGEAQKVFISSAQQSASSGKMPALTYNIHRSNIASSFPHFLYFRGQPGKKLKSGVAGKKCLYTMGLRADSLVDGLNALLMIVRLDLSIATYI